MQTDYLSSSPRSIMKKHGKSFYFASQIFRSSMLDEISRLYSYCRFVDDNADELKPYEAKQAIEEILKVLTGVSSNEKLNPLIEELESQGVTREQMQILAEGALFDVDKREIENINDLLVYCYKVAGIVGLMVCPIIGVKDPKAYPHAIDLGIGMQLTNICRDILEDAQNGRSYVPKNDLIHNNLRLDELARKGLAKRKLKNLVKKYLDIADVYYSSSIHGYAYIPFRPRLTILVASEVYRAIGNKIRRNDYEVLLGRTYLSLPEKFFVTMKALRKMFSLKFWLKGIHLRHLHRSLQGLPGVSKV